MSKRYQKPTPKSSSFCSDGVKITECVWQLLRQNGLRSWAELARNLGRAPNTLATAQRKGSWTDNLLRDIANFFGVSTAELRRGQWAAPARKLEEDERLSLPVVGMAAADETNGALTAPEAAEDQYRLPDNLGVVEVTGDSLQPLAWNGQRVLVDLIDRTPHDGDIVVVQTADERILVKRWQREGRQIVLSPVSRAPELRAIVLNQDDVETVRVVVGVLFE